jgi:cyclopropane fatty-acyl-phospholipid synthase-like methyltransferase
MAHTQKYVEQLKKLHEKKSFGVSAKIPNEVIECFKKYEIKSLLDFGCGKGHTLEEFKRNFPDMECIGYDPAREGYNTLPNSVDFIYSSDVLEHIEPDQLDETLNDLHSRANKAMYHLIACHPAKKGLSDGRNAHLIIEKPEWWRDKLKSLGWNIIHESVKEYTTQPKKGPELFITKYIIIVEK